MSDMEFEYEEPEIAMSYEDLLAVYDAQCALTDELARRLAEGSNKALLDRIEELEAALEKVNDRLSRLQSFVFTIGQR